MRDGIKFFCLKKGAPHFLFAALVILAFFILPSLGRSNLGPLFDWDLFSNTHHRPFFDLVVELKGHRRLLSELNSTGELTSANGFIAWGLTQSIAVPKETVEAVPDRIRMLKKVLAVDAARPLVACEIKIKLADYMSMSSEERSGHCEVLSPEI